MHLGELTYNPGIYPNLYKSQLSIHLKKAWRQAVPCEVTCRNSAQCIYHNFLYTSGDRQVQVKLPA